MRLLLIEASEKLRSSLVPALVAAGYLVEVAESCAGAVGLMQACAYAMVVMDLAPRTSDALGLLKGLRQRGDEARVLVLTGREQVNDRVMALDQGADASLVKPVLADQLVSRLALLRERGEPPPPICIGEVSLDSERRLVRCKGQPMALSPKEFELLECLMRHRGRMLTRTALYAQLYAGHPDASEKVIEVLMSTLRSKLSRLGASELIETRRGLGYVIPN